MIYQRQFTLETGLVEILNKKLCKYLNKDEINNYNKIIEL